MHNTVEAVQSIRGTQSDGSVDNVVCIELGATQRTRWGELAASVHLCCLTRVRLNPDASIFHVSMDAWATDILVVGSRVVCHSGLLHNCRIQDGHQHIQ